MTIISKGALASALVLASAIAAQAGTVTLTQQEANIFGTPDLSVSVDRLLTNENQPMGQSTTLSAGAFRLNDGTMDLIVYCVEPGIGIDLSQSFDTMSSPLNATEEANLERLFEVGYTTSLTSAEAAAAFQAAIWEIVTDNFDFDLDAGDHQITNAQGVKDQAALYFADMADISVSGPQYNITTYVNDGQDLISVSPVPLPAGAVLLASALGGLALRRRLNAA